MSQYRFFQLIAIWDMGSENSGIANGGLTDEDAVEIAFHKLNILIGVNASIA